MITSRMLKIIEGKKSAISVSFAIVIILILIGSYLQSFNKNVQTMNNNTRYVNITLFIYIFSDRDISEAFDVYFPIPFDADNQKVISLSFSRDPDEILQDEWNQSIAMFKISSMKEGEIQEISMSCVARLVSIEYSVDPEKIGSLSEIPEQIRVLYTRDEEMYKIQDPIVISCIDEAIGDTKSAYNIVVRLHDYVIERLSYKLDSRWDDAPTTLRRGEGSCSEYTFVYISLCRAAGVPSRFAGGTVIDPSLAGNMLTTEIIDYMFHRWVEVYIPNYGWLPVDVTYDEGYNTREFLFSLRDTSFAFVRRGGSSRYLGWSYLPTLDPKVKGVVLRAKAVWAPIPEAQKTLSSINRVEKILFQVNKAQNSTYLKEIRDLIEESLRELDQGSFSSAYIHSQKALSMAMEIEMSLEQRQFLLLLFLLTPFLFLTIILAVRRFRWILFK